MSKKLRLAVTFVLLGWLAYKIDWRKLVAELAHMRIELWLLAIGVYMLAQLASSMRWRWLAEPLGFKQPLSHFLGFYFIGMFFNMVLPTSVGGDVVRAWFLDGKSGRRLPAFLSVLADRGSGLVVLLSLACLGVVFYPYPLDPVVKSCVWITAGLAVSGLGLVAAIGIWKRKSPRTWDDKALADSRRSGLSLKLWHFKARLRGLVLSLAHTFLLYVRLPSLVFGTTLLSFVVQAANVLLVWLIGQSVGLSIPAGYYWILVPMVSLATMIPVDINGVALRPLVTYALLKPLGIAEEKADVLAVMWFFAILVGSMSGVAFYVFGQYPRYDAGESAAANEGSPSPDMEVRLDDGSFCGDPHQGRAGQPSTA